jgi:hypothetical protein
VLAALGAVLVTDAVSGLVGTLSAALNDAAAADKNGYQLSTVSAGYFDYVRRVGADYQLSPPGCYVVALAKPDRDAKPWCEQGSALSAGSKASCENGAALINELAKNPDRVHASTTHHPLASPLLYVEIALPDTPYARSPPQYNLVVPVIDALYYPRPLIAGTIESGKPRHLTLTITFANPSPATSDSATGGAGNATDYFKGAAVALDLLGIVPGTQIPPMDIASNLHTAWTTVPLDKLPQQFAFTNAENSGEPFKPISIAASVHEVGDPSKFLQAFASAFASQSSQSGITNAITGAVIPPTDVAQAQNKSAYQSAQSKYLAAVSAYQSACAKLQSDRSDATSGSSTATKSRAAIPSDTTALQAAQVGAQGAYSAWVATQLQYPDSGSKPVEVALSCN